jgi:acyl-CoA thioester hydrolase
MSHHFTLRVYYEDTDLAGIVYYANYLKYIERARTEWVRAIGVDQGRLRSEAGVVFAVRRVEADYLRPARFDDELQVQTRLVAFTGARIVLEQDITRMGERLFASVVTLVCLTDDGLPARIPVQVRLAMGAAPH